MAAIIMMSLIDVMSMAPALAAAPYSFSKFTISMKYNSFLVSSLERALSGHMRFRRPVPPGRAAKARHPGQCVWPMVKPYCWQFLNHRAMENGKPATPYGRIIPPQGKFSGISKIGEGAEVRL